MHKFQGMKEPFDYGSTVLEFQPILTMYLKILEMGILWDLVFLFFLLIRCNWNVTDVKSTICRYNYLKLQMDSPRGYR